MPLPSIRLQERLHYSKEHSTLRPPNSYLFQLCGFLKGKCRCDSSEQAGYYYGTYCEMENECEVDQNCGEGGVCQDTKVIAITGMASQSLFDLR